MHEVFVIDSGHVCCSNLRQEMNVPFGESKTVLVVGKQLKEIAYLTKHLSIAGYAILVARTGAGAIQSTKEHAPDVVLLELDCPIWRESMLSGRSEKIQ
jgi:CheY-like chemotaxis protein